MVRLRVDDDKDLIDFIEKYKDRYGTSEIFKAGLGKIKNDDLAATPAHIKCIEASADIGKSGHESDWTTNTVIVTKKPGHDLNEERQVLAFSSVESKTIPRERALLVDRQPFNLNDIEDRVIFVRPRENGYSVQELEDMYPGKERHMALKRFTELQKQNSVIECETHIERGKLER